MNQRDGPGLQKNTAFSTLYGSDVLNFWHSYILKEWNMHFVGK